MSFFRRLFRPAAPPESQAPPPPARPVAAPAVSSPAAAVAAVRRVMMVTHDPVVDGEGTTLSKSMGWYDPQELARQYIADVAQASHGLLQYRIAVREVRDGFPALVDGFRYDPQGFLRCWRQRRGFHTPEGADYPALLREFGVLERVNAGEIDELWLFGGPYAGYYESLMVGPGSFWCNSPPLDRLSSAVGPACRRRFVVMGFNYEREVGCMLENLGHRAESIMARVFEGRSGEANLWEHFTRYDQVAPGRASVGNVHFAPNSTSDYDWGNPRPVLSDCDDWLAFPNLTGERRRVDCRQWGDGDMRLHHLWWFERLPHVGGETAGIAHNWWRYITDPDTV
jgi:hypothetical protein